MKKIGILLLAIPFAFYFSILGDHFLAFIFSLISLIPLSSILGEYTERLGEYLGESIGGFLNATFGNAVEIIVSLMAIQAGLFSLVKASITGSIIGNMLFVLGLSIVFGTLKHKQQFANKEQIAINSTILLLAISAFIIPSIFYYFSNGSQLLEKEEELSLAISVILILTYLIHTYYSFKLNSNHSSKKKIDKKAFIYGVYLFLGTIVVFFVSEIFVGAIEPIAHQFNLTEMFIGAIIIAVIGNAVEHLSAIMASMKNKVDMALSITVGSSIQIATFIYPLLVIISFLMNKPMNFLFNSAEIAAVVLSVFIVNDISNDGKYTFIEGVMLISLYLIIAVLFFFF